MRNKNRLRVSGGTEKLEERALLSGSWCNYGGHSGGGEGGGEGGKGGGEGGKGGGEGGKKW